MHWVDLDLFSPLLFEGFGYSVFYLLGFFLLVVSFLCTKVVWMEGYKLH